MTDLAEPVAAEAPDPAAEAPRWLTDDEQRAWRDLLTLLLQLPGPLDGQLQRDSGLSLFEYLVLSSLSMEPSRTLRMSALARLVNGSLSRLSNVVKRLEQRGWVERHLDPVDGRYTVATLTASGHDTVVAAAPGHVAAVRALVVDPLGPDGLQSLAAAARQVTSQLPRPARARAGTPDGCAPGFDGEPCDTDAAVEARGVAGAPDSADDCPPGTP